MPVCTGGSQPKTGIPAYIALVGEGIASLLSVRFKWLGLVAGLASPFVLDINTFCASDPPAVPSWTVGDVLALLSPIQSDAKIAASAKLTATILNVAWYQFCECTVGGPVTPPAPTSPPADFPLINPTPPQPNEGGSGYVAEVIADSPIQYWRFAESDGRIAHSIGPAPRIPLYADYDSVHTLGYSGPVSDGGAMFSFLNGWYNASLDVLGSPGFTFEVWLWRAFKEFTGSSLLLSIGTVSTRAVDLFTEADQWNFGWPNQFAASAPVGADLLEWEHIVYTNNGTNGQAWRNGEAGVARTHSMAFNLQGPIGIKCYDGGVFVAEMALYDTVLSEARIQAHYAAADAKSFRPVWRGTKLAQLQELGPSSAAAEPLLELVTLIQRQEVPFGYIASTVHAGLTGSGVLTVSGLIGVRVDYTVIPAYIGWRAGDPVTYFDVGSLAFGTTDGYTRRELLRHDPQLVFSDEMGLYTRIGYTFPPGITATITELVREP